MEYGIWKGNAFCGALWYGRCITWSPRNVLRDEWGYSKGFPVNVPGTPYFYINFNYELYRKSKDLEHSCIRNNISWCFFEKNNLVIKLADLLLVLGVIWITMQVRSSLGSSMLR